MALVAIIQKTISKIISQIFLFMCLVNDNITTLSSFEKKS